MKTTTSKQLCAHLQSVRHAKGWSQAKMGEIIGIRQGTISKFEQLPDKSTIETLFKLLAALELEIELKPRNSQDISLNNDTQTSDKYWGEEW